MERRKFHLYDCYDYYYDCRDLCEARKKVMNHAVDWSGGTTLSLQIRRRETYCRMSSSWGFIIGVEFCCAQFDGKFEILTRFEN
jgi:hypothetical protein